MSLVGRFLRGDFFLRGARGGIVTGGFDIFGKRIWSMIMREIVFQFSFPDLPKISGHNFSKF